MEDTNKFEIKIDPLDLHIGLKDHMYEFESLIRMPRPGVSIAEKIEKDLNSRFCHCCFFGHVKGELNGEPLCEECAKILYGFDENEEHPSIKKIDPYYQLWYRRRKALPIFEAYLHSEIERYKLEQKLENEKASNYAESVDAGMENRRLKRALWIARAERAKEHVWHDVKQDGSPKEDYKGRDWVLVQLREIGGFELIPRIAEYRQRLKRWVFIDEEYDSENSHEFRYLRDKCVVIGWRDIDFAYYGKKFFVQQEINKNVERKCRAKAEEYK